MKGGFEMFVIWYTDENGDRIAHEVNTLFYARWLKKCYKIYGYKKIKLYTDGGIRIPLF